MFRPTSHTAFHFGIDSHPHLVHRGPTLDALRSGLVSRAGGRSSAKSRCLRRLTELAVLVACVAPAVAQTSLGTAFTYQGQLKFGGAPANGSYDFRFTLYDDAVPVGGVECHDDVSVVNGLFDVPLDFGPDAAVFNGEKRFLHVEVRPGHLGDCTVPEGFVPLAPQQAVTAAPYALKVPGVDGHSLDAADGAPADVVFVNEDGRVGIGTVDPGSSLEVGGGVRARGGPPGQFGVNNNGYAFSGNGGDDDSGMFSTGNGQVVLYTDSAERMRISYSNVGIGTSNPSAPLDVVGTIQSSGAAGGEFAALNPSNPSAFMKLGWLNDVARIRVGGIGAGAAGGLDIQRFGDVSLLRIFNSGNVGIGTSNPLAGLHVVASSLAMPPEALLNEDLVVEAADAVLGLYSGPFGAFGSAISLGEVAEAALTDKWTLYRATAGAGSKLGFSFGTSADYSANPTYLTIGSSGHVGIGNTSPTAPLSFGNVFGDLITLNGDADGPHFGVGIQGGLLQFYAALAVHDLAFGTGSSTAFNEVMRIKGAGKVGIGTSNPNASLDVVGTIQSSGAAGGELSALNPGNPSAFVKLGWLNNLARIRVGGTGSGANNGLDIQGPGDGSILRVVGSTGNVGIGTATPGAKMEVRGGLGPTSLLVMPGNSFGMEAGNQVTLDIPAATGRLNVMDDFAVANDAFKPGGGSWSALSDARLKKNIEPLRGALARVLSLRGVTFEFNEDGSRTGLAMPGRQVGFVAQQVQEVFPNWVSRTPEGYQYVTERGSTALLVEALRELRAEKDTQLAHRDAEIAALRERLTRLEAASRKANPIQREEKP